MLSYTKLSGNVRRFKTLMGMSLQEFDLLFAKVEKAHPEAERERLFKRPRRRAIVAGRRLALDLRNRVLLLFYYGTYATQDVAAEVFGVGQATVSRSIDPIAPVVRQCIPIPAKIHGRAKRASTLEELGEIFLGLRCLIDASEPALKDPRLRGTCHPEGQDLTDNGRGVPEPVEEVRPDQRCRLRAGKPPMLKHPVIVKR